MSRSKTLVVIKPDGVRKNLIPEILSRFNHQTEFEMIELRNLSIKEASELYLTHSKEEWYPDLVEWMARGRCVVIVLSSPVWEMKELIRYTRGIVKVVRGVFQTDTRNNVIHASDSPEAAERELKIFYDEEA